jgi:hypothetical protein
MDGLWIVSVEIKLNFSNLGKVFLNIGNDEIYIKV